VSFGAQQARSKAMLPAIPLSLQQNMPCVVSSAHLQTAPKDGCRMAEVDNSAYAQTASGELPISFPKGRLASCFPCAKAQASHSHASHSHAPHLHESALSQSGCSSSLTNSQCYSCDGKCSYHSDVKVGNIFIGKSVSPAADHRGRVNTEDVLVTIWDSDTSVGNSTYGYSSDEVPSDDSLAYNLYSAGFRPPRPSSGIGVSHMIAIT